MRSAASVLLAIWVTLAAIAYGIDFGFADGLFLPPMNVFSVALIYAPMAALLVWTAAIAYRRKRDR